MSQNPVSTGGTFQKIIIILVLLLIAWNIYTGATVQEIGIPGLFTIKFGEKHSSGNSNNPASQPNPTDNWAGNWTCAASDHTMNLTISGKGLTSTLKGYYPTAYGNQPANEDYTIQNMTASEVSGEYVYYDTSPNIGCRGKSGVFCGTWSITFSGDELILIRMDNTTAWRGDYRCYRP
jgi:hypothetical protein